MLRSLFCAMSLVVVLNVGVAQVQADTTTWDAAAGWHTDHNTSSDTWQYYRGDAGQTANNTLNTNFVNFGGGQYAWANPGGDNYVCNMPSAPSLLDMAPTSQDIAIGWQSPITGVVDLSYSLAAPANANASGMHYWVLQGTTPLAQGDIFASQATGTLTISHLSVAAGDKLYLREGSKDAGVAGYYDTTFTMTVTSVPEPSAIILLAGGLIGLLAYAWRKRKCVPS
jgi:hypothetical protein